MTDTDPSADDLKIDLPIEPHFETDLPPVGSWPASRHRFDEASAWAVKTMIEAQRPLLLRGEPGIGKSQLARAVAHVLGVPFLSHVVDERSERDDLLYHYDAIARLAEAQVASLTAKEDPNWKAALAEGNFLEPGVLWWAYDWAGAHAQATTLKKAGRPVQFEEAPADWTADGPTAPCGPVVLIDEIDKADPSVPNGLLESLGNGGFFVRQLGRSVSIPAEHKPPLVFITTNEERELPAAFLRRCLVMQMNLPVDPTDFLRKRARVFSEHDGVPDAVLNEIARQLVLDREEADRLGMAKPGAAEYLDIVRVLAGLKLKTEAEQLRALEKIKAFALRKNRDERL